MKKNIVIILFIRVVNMPPLFYHKFDIFVNNNEKYEIKMVFKLNAIKEILNLNIVRKKIIIIDGKIRNMYRL